MNRLVLAFGIVCLLQGLSAEPNPSFGLTNTLTATARISSVKGDAKTTSDAISALTVPNIVSGFAGLTGLKTQIEAVISNFGAKSNPIITAYEALITATDGSVQAKFADFINAIDTASLYIANEATQITGAITQLTYIGVSDQLKDAFERIAVGLADLKAKANTVQNALLAALAGAGAGVTDIPADILRQNLPLSKMYDLLRASTNLKAYLPLVQYILKTTIENIKEADDYLGKLQTALDTATPAETAKFTTDINTLLNNIKGQISSDFSADNSEAGKAVTAIGQLTNLGDAPKYTALLAVANTLNNLFSGSTLQPQITVMEAAFNHISTAVDALLAQLKATVNVVTDPTVKLLIDTLLGDDEYGRYCYNKYKDLISGLFGQSFDSSYQCADKEYERLEYLQFTLGLIADLMEADYEDIQAQVTVCDTVKKGSTNQNECVAAMVSYYEEVFKATTKKIEALYTFATDEAIASENRLLICFELVYFEGSVVLPEKITKDLQNCALEGPAGTKE